MFLVGGTVVSEVRIVEANQTDIYLMNQGSEPTTGILTLFEVTSFFFFICQP